MSNGITVNTALVLVLSKLAKMVAYDKDAVFMSAVGGAVLGASTAALMGLTGKNLAPIA
jgi:hypothetical protein